MAEQSSIPRDDIIHAGDDASRAFYEAARRTYGNQPGLLREVFTSFTGLRSTSLGSLGANLEMGLESDGIGTKVEIAERVGRHDTIAFDLLAMMCDDAAVRGAEPVLVNTVFDVNTLGKETDPQELRDYIRRAMGELATGYVTAANAANVVISGGEIAVIGDRVGGFGPFNYNWGGTALWLAHRDRQLTGTELRPGHALVGLAEKGFRSNGITNVREAMLERYGDNWHDVVDRSLGGLTLGQLALAPSTIYSGFMSRLTGGYDITREPLARVTGAAHITGGGQPSKLGRMLEPSGLGVVITDPIAPPDIMLKMQGINGYPDREAYGKWHMGPGMVVVTPDPEQVLAAAEANGVAAQEIGVVTEKPGILIRNMGAGSDTRWLEFNSAT